MRDALAQHRLRQRAAAKFGRAAEMFFTGPGLEQASSQHVSRHRARRYAGLRQVADLCCGIGGDLVELARGSRVLAVDADPLHLRMAAANAGVHGVADNVVTRLADVRDVSLAGVDAVFIDPARRAGARQADRRQASGRQVGALEVGARQAGQRAGRRLRAGDSEPPLDWCLSVAGRVGRVGIKAAPGIGHDAIPPGWELEFVAIGRELKEAVAWSPAMATAARRATILPGGHTLVSAGVPAAQVRAPGEYLFDPSPAVTRAGLVAELAAALGAWQIDPRIAFLSAGTAAVTPFARMLRVIDSAPWDQKRLPARLRALDVGAVDIRRRGLAGDVPALHRRLRPGGSRRVTLVMTRVLDRPWALVCVDPGQTGC